MDENLQVIVQQFPGETDKSAAYELRLVGDGAGERGFLLKDEKLNEGTFTVRQIHILSGADVFVKAVLPKPIEIPSGLIKAGAGTVQFRDFDTELKPEISRMTKAQAARFRARRAESFRRLLTIEIDWGVTTGAFLDKAGGSVKARGEAKLALAHIVAKDEVIAFAAAAVAEFRASVSIEVIVNATKVRRFYGVVVRCGINAAATISIDLDDFNLSLPDVVLPSFDVTKGRPLKVPDVFGPVAGAFSRLVKDLKVTYEWKSGDDPQLVVMLVAGQLLFGVLKGGLDASKYDLTRSEADLATDLATLEKATVATKDDKIRLQATGIQLAVHKAGTILKGELEAFKEFNLDPGSRKMGPIEIKWDGVVLTPRSGEVKIDGTLIEPDASTARVTLTFERVTITVTDDPSAFVSLKGEIEITTSGARIIALELIEPYPVELIAKAAAAAVRGAQKILQFLAHLEPPGGDASKLKKLLEILAKIATAVARAAVLVADAAGEILKEAADLIAGALTKVAELIGALLSRLADALSSLKPLPAVDIEIRLALDPLELRQILITLSGTGAEAVTKKFSAIGLDFAIPDGWRPALLIDFVTEPGAYLMAFRPDAKDVEYATVSTDLWLKRSADLSSPVRDASGDKGERSDKPLLQVKAERINATQPLFLVIGGVSRGQAVFFRYAGDPVNASVLPIDIPIPGGTKVKVSVLDRSFALLPLDKNKLKVTFEFDKERVLGLLGMGEPGKEETTTSGGFLEKLKKGLGQVVTIKELKAPKVEKRGDKTVLISTIVLGVKAAGLSTDVTLGFELDETLEVKLTGGADAFPLNSKRIEERALGLTWIVEQTDTKKLEKNDEVPMFNLVFAGSEGGFGLNKREARMELRFEGLSSDGQGLVFDVEEFHVGRGGLDLVATVRDRAVRLNGIDVPFRFTSGRLEVRGGVLLGAVIVGRGELPPTLVGEANCTAALAFAFENGEIVLQSGKVELEKKGEPIVCHSTRFTLTVTDLDIAFVRENGYHFYFLVSGSLRFTPKVGEFDDGLLKHLEDVEMTLERTPLSADPRVLLRHISFQKALNPRKTFSLFNLFTFELRGFGFHPASPKFEGRPPAVNISGQIRFCEIGDVMQPKIDFHGLWIAPPKAGESLPRIKADGLGVDLQLAGSVKVRGAVLAVDPDTKTVEGRSLAPDGFNTYGFLGEGALEIPGWGSMEASMGFLEVEEKERPGNRKPAFFLYLQKNKLAIEIPTPIWTFYLREVGFGFGFRFTLEGIRRAEEAKSVAQLVKTLDEVSMRQGDLARFTAWLPEGNKDNFTLAMRGAFQPMPAEKVYDPEKEEQAVSPFFFDIVAALRSDFTFLMSMRGWLGVNYASFLANTGGFRENPGFRAYLYISAPRSELLMRGIAKSKGFVGEDFPLVKKGQPLRQAVESVDWTTTLYIRPGLFHYEMGWPDQLMVRLVDEKNMRVFVRGGMIFRAAEEGLLLGYNIGAEAFMRFEGRAGGSIGVALVAEMNATFVARILAFISSSFRGSLVYGLVSLDARLTFSVEAWMDVDLGFTSFTLRIGFSFSVQFSAAVELAISDGGVGGRVAARIAVQVFGCTLGVSVGFSFNDAQLDAARARVQRFLALSITAEEPDSPAVFTAKTGDKAIDENAKSAEAVHKKPAPPTTPNAGQKPSNEKSKFGRPESPGVTDFHLVLRKATRGPGGMALEEGKIFAYALLVPKEPTDLKKAGYYAVPVRGRRAHKIAGESLGDDVKICAPGTDDFEIFTPKDITPRWDAPIDVGGKKDTFTLGHFFDECFLADTKWQGNPPIRVASNWREPLNLRVHTTVGPLSGSADERKQAREQQQKAQAAEAVENAFDERAYQARSTVLTMFIDQFVTLAATGHRTNVKVGDALEAHVTDLGLVLFGPVEKLEKLGGRKLIKFSEKDKEQEGTIEVFNPREVWFDNQDPVLADERCAVDADGIKLDWRLSMPHVAPDPNHYLDHYEIVRTIETDELNPCVMQVKPCPTLGCRQEEKIDGILKKTEKIEVQPPDWQFVDTLAEKDGIDDPEVRRALLPSFGESESFEAAKAWLKVFRGDRDEVTLTYSVTPVDCAGVHGLPRSFTVDVRRPQPALRPAIGELRMVQTLAASNDGVQMSEARPKNLKVYLALNDRAWDDPIEKKDREPTIGGVKYRVERVYRLIVDPEDLEPAGNYGSDASTARVRAPGAFAPKKTADEKPFDVKRSETDSAEKFKEIEPDEEERKNLPLWAEITDKVSATEDKTALLDLLWKGSKGRVATRFFLETMVVFTPLGAKLPAVTHVSKRVVLPVEHVIIAPERDRGNSTATLRPEAFELAVPLVLPPLGEGQIHAESGFARFRVPKANARLRDLEGGGGKAMSLVRDAERRVLTTVRFAAVPDWAGGVNLADAPRPLHGSSIAGFDLYELDFDDLAPVDVLDDSAPKDVDLAENPAAWMRARRVARVEHLPREESRLVPTGNADWQGWQAHYPSETQRLTTAKTGDRGGDFKPIRTAWYSDRETTPHFAERRPRLRLLPLVPETAIAELMRGGRPQKIFASLRVPSDLGVTFVELRPLTVDTLQLDKAFTPGPAATKRSFTKTNNSLFDAKDLRNLLLCLGWPRFNPNDRILLAWQKSSKALDGLTLVLEGVADFTPFLGTTATKPTGSVEIPINLASPVHPLLEEVIAELALSTRDGDAVYRRYTVMPQPVTTMAAKDFAGFMAGTAAEADPYGWKVLQTLGCATTVRLFDCATESFLKPEELRKCVDRVFSSVLARWIAVYGDNVIGQPFADVFLKPASDRLPGPFEAIIENAVEEELPPPLRLDDEGLGFLQLSLRPRPAAAWTYMQQKSKWVKKPEKTGFHLRATSIRVTSKKEEEVEVARARGGPIAEIPAGEQSALIPIPMFGAKDEELTLFFRVAGKTGAADRPKIEVVLEWESLADGVREVEHPGLDDANCPIKAVDDWSSIAEPAKIHPDPFERFKSVGAERWAEAFAGRKSGINDQAIGAFLSLRDAVKASFPADFVFPEPAAYNTISSAYLTWSQRFLDHAASRPAGGETLRFDQPFIALAAPTKASPWKLAADAEGYLKLTFLHSDRWAHMRAYAVRPIGRYHDVLAGIGIEAEKRAEIFEKFEKRRIGFAVAISPRTEKIEPPVIVRSRLAMSVPGSENADELVTEILVARHGEESFAGSNRPLLARLGLPTSLLAFSRLYRHTEWPKRLEAAFESDAPSAELHPVRKAAMPEEDKLAEQIDAVVVRDIADGYPSLWKGSDIWHVAPQPPHYKVIALAAERAGVVVSDVAKVVQEEQPRRPLAKREAELFPVQVTVALSRDIDDGSGKKQVRLELTHDLISHALLTTKRAEKWLGHGKKDDVCWWPDPDVIYSLLRRGAGKEEQDAEIKLVAAVEDDTGDVKKRRPVVLRVLGPMYVAVEKGGRQQIILTSKASDDGAKRTFTLKTSLMLRPEKTIRLDTHGITRTESGSNSDIEKFNEKTALFAAILTAHKFTFDLAVESGDTVTTYVARLKPLRDALEKGAAALVKLKEKDLPWIDETFAADLRIAVAKIDAAITANPSSIDDLRALAELPLVRTTVWRRPDKLPADLLMDQVKFVDSGEGAPTLAVWDMAADDEIKKLKAAGVPASKDGARLYKMLARRLVGEAKGFFLQATDARARITMDRDGKPTGTPGVATVPIHHKEWLDKALEGGSL